MNNKTLGDYYEQVVSEALGDSDSEKRKVYKLAANWVVTELQKLLKASNTDISHLKITAENFGEFVNILSRGEINSSAGQIALSEMFETGADPSQIIADKNLGQVNDVLELEKIAREVISENPKAVADFQSGNEKILMFLVGKVMAKTGGRANPEIAQKALRASLRGGRSKAADEAISLI